jgi:hypothetical protein
MKQRSHLTTTREGIMRKSLGLTLTLSAISFVIGIGGIGQSFAQGMQRSGTTDTTADKSAGRIGGQGGKKPHLEKPSEASRSRGAGRIGGQSGTRTPLETRKSSYGSMGGKRVGGQSGVERDVEKSSGKTK